VRIYVLSKKQGTKEFEVNWVGAIVIFTSHVLSIGAKTESSDEPMTDAAPWGTWIAKEPAVLD
jgi:hypothetical protein